MAVAAGRTARFLGTGVTRSALTEVVGSIVLQRTVVRGPLGTATAPGVVQMDGRSIIEFNATDGPIYVLLTTASSDWSTTKGQIMYLARTDTNSDAAVVCDTASLGGGGVLDVRGQLFQYVTLSTGECIQVLRTTDSFMIAGSSGTLTNLLLQPADGDSDAPHWDGSAHDLVVRNLLTAAHLISTTDLVAQGTLTADGALWKN